MYRMTAANVRPTVMLADDHARVLETVFKLLSPGFNILATASEGSRALQACIELNPDVAVLDICMPELDGIGAARQLRRVGCLTRIVFLTVLEDEDYVAAALDVGARGYVLKSRMHSDLIPAMEHALANEALVYHRPLGR